MSSCACVYNSGGGEGPDFDSTTHPKARKPHKCIECRRVIHPGETYERVAGKWDGRMGAYKTCNECAEIRTALMCEGWTYGHVWEDVREHWSGGGNILGCIDELSTVAAKNKLADAWRDHQNIPQ